MTTEGKIRKSDTRRQRGNRSGYTTGACSAAAARAATLGLCTGDVPASVVCRLPNGHEVPFSVLAGEVVATAGERVARAVVVKDAGDDPDVTNGAHLTAAVRQLAGRAGEIVLLGGPGVGTVTREGLGLQIGSAAINPVPRRNICDNVRAAGAALLAHAGLEVTISVPGGEQMAARTLNARLGILGGISILGTTGIVIPYSTAAFRASVVQAIDVAASQQPCVVLTTGGRTEKFAMQQLPQLDAACFVQMGDFVKAAFQRAIRNQMSVIYVGAMTGKLTKMCQGLPVTHAWKGEVDRSILATVAGEIGAPAALIDEIRAAETARFAAERLAALGLSAAFHRRLAKQAMCSLRDRYPGDYRLVMLVCDFNGQPICRVEENDAD